MACPTRGDHKQLMTSAILSDLPPPPPGKTGWPWTVETRPLPDARPDGTAWPRISIVTPSYNQGQFIEETIRSVLLQGYPNLEYIIIDGGSTDDSVEIIRKYERHLAYWVSEKDRGQSHAINKGLSNITGEIWAYINSDDVYTKGTFARVAEVFGSTSADWVTGDAAYVTEDGRYVRMLKCQEVWDLADIFETLVVAPVQVSVQPSNFMSRRLLLEREPFDETLHYCMDMDLQLRLLLSGFKPNVLKDVLCHARLHEASKTVHSGWGGRFEQERALILERIDLTSVQRYKAQIFRALRDYRKQQVLEAVRQEWMARGRLSAAVALLRAMQADFSLILDRPALGLARRVLFHRLPIA